MYSEILKNLGARALKDDSIEQCSYEQVRSELGIRLPDDYVSLLNNYNGSIVFDNGAMFKPKQKTPIDSENGFQSLEILYGLSGKDNLIKKNVMYKDQIPAGFVIIGESIGGSQVCMSSAGGGIYFWFHESETDDGSLFVVSDSLNSFINSLIIDDMQGQNKREVDDSGSFLDF